MKKTICALLAAALHAGAALQGGPREIDVYETGRFDLDGDGIMEQLVITSGGGTGGPVWYLARLSGVRLSDEMQGRLWIVPKKSGYPDLLVRYRCGGREYHTSLLRYDGEKYQCINEKTERKPD